METTHEKYMRRCIELGLVAKANGNAPVGSVIVMDNKIIGEGFEGEKGIPQPIAHAETIALVKAVKYRGSNDLRNCILYTSKEPCFMCSFLIRQTAIKGVVFASRSGETGGAGPVFSMLNTDRVEKWTPPPFLIEGILREECEKLLG